MFCDRIAVLNHGRLVAVGKPHEVLSTKTIRDIFHVEATVKKTDTGLHICYLRQANILQFQDKKTRQ